MSNDAQFLETPYASASQSLGRDPKVGRRLI